MCLIPKATLGSHVPGPGDNTSLKTWLSSPITPILWVSGQVGPRLPVGRREDKGQVLALFFFFLRDRVLLYSLDCP
jgi:hypothetical protein